MTEEKWIEKDVSEELVAQWLPNRLFSRRDFAKLFGAAAISAAGLAALAGCAPQGAPAPTAPPGAQKTARKLKIGYIIASATHHAGLSMAGEKGFLVDEGIQPEWGEFAAGAPMIQAIASGDLDVGSCGVYPALMGRAQGVDLRIVAGSNLEGSLLIAGPAIKDVKDLDGQKVATPGIASIQDSLLLLVEEKYGIKVGHFYAKVTDMATYLKNGEVAAYIVWEPTGSASLEKSGGHILLTSKDIRPSHQCCVLVTSGKLIQSEPETVLNLVKAHEKGIKFAKDNPDEVDRFVAKDAATTVEIAKKANANASYLYPSYVQTSEMSFTIDTLVKFKKLQSGQISDTEQFIKDNYVDSFLKKVHS